MGLKRLVFFFSFPATLVIPFSEGGLIVCVWVGGKSMKAMMQNLLHVVKRVLTKRDEFRESIVSKCRKLSMQAHFSCFLLGDVALGSSGTKTN